MAITLELLDCGTLTTPRSAMESGATDDPVRLPIPAWLIRHPDGLALVDCGMPADLSAPGKYLDRISSLFDVGLDTDDLITAQLAGVDVDAADIDIVVLTHLHFDHTGGLGQLPNARVIVQENEWAAGADDERARRSGFVPSDYRHGHDIVTVDGEHDVFGDGTILCIPTPGHTPGHQSVRVRLADREIVLCGDCAYFESTLTTGALPPRGHDLELQAASVRHLLTLKSQGAQLIPGHDPDTLGSLPRRLT